MTRSKEHSQQLGWLKNEARLRRKTTPPCLTDKQVQFMLSQICDFKGYTKQEPNIDTMIKIRDSALIATNWIWFKRANEILRLKFGDLTLTDTQVMVNMLIEKKQKKYKICPYCEKEVKNSRKSNFCKICGNNIENLDLTVLGAKPEPKTKRKGIDFHFCKYLVTWFEVMHDYLNADLDSWLFPRYHNFSGKFLLHSKNHLTVQWYDKMLQRLEPTMTSAMFRYGGAEKYLNLGYSPRKVAEMGDWSNSQMPERYAQRKGLTPAQREFADDMRLI